MDKDQALNEFNAWVLHASESGLLRNPSDDVACAVQAKAKDLGISVDCSVRNGALHIDILDLKGVVERTGRSCGAVWDPSLDLHSPSYHYDRLLQQFKPQFGEQLGVFVANRASSLFRKRKLSGHCIGGVYACVETSPSSVLDFVLARKYWRYGWAEGEYMFKRRFLGIPVFVAKVTIGIAYE